VSGKGAITGWQLNTEQLRAVTFGDGPLLVVAGAGSGKTRVLTYRVAQLLHERGIPAPEILAFTFTNRAAREMRERLEDLVGSDSRDLWVGTFHATCLRLLRREAGRLDLSPHFSIFDRDDQIALTKRLLKDRDIDLREHPPGFILSRISSAKNELLGPGEYESSAVTPRERMIAGVYGAYQEELSRQQALDFDDLIASAVHLLETDQTVRQRWGERFRHVLVDEYQDTNQAQRRLVSAFSAGHGNVLAVGDEDQSIYAWRGADISNILDFERHFPGAQVVRLEQNYRSTSIILDAASAVIANNRRRRGKTLWTDREGGSQIRVILSGDEQAEGMRLAQEVERFTRRGGSPRHFAILYRTNAQSRALELAFRQRGVAYELVGGVSFYERREIKDLLAYLRLAVNPRDRVSFLRIANVPRRGLGERALAHLAERLRDSNELPGDALATLASSGGLSPQARRGAANLVQLLAALHAARTEPPEALLERILGETAYLDYLEENFSQDSADRRENVEELVGAARDFTVRHGEVSAEEFVSEAALVADVDRWSDTEDRAVLMTAHNAKGLEFSVVAISGCEEGVFPHSSAFGDEDELEEERRLFYVALTRAKDEAIVSAAAFRRRFDGRGAGELSRFVQEIPPQLLSQHQPAGWPRPGGGSRQIGIGGVDASRMRQDEHTGRVVYHETFGRGTILGSEGDGGRMKFTVRFPSVGVKKVLGRFLLPDE
jgi:DNA helicase-2/ATP-dependent DNA helicase PcrA